MIRSNFLPRHPFNENRDGARDCFQDLRNNGEFAHPCHEFDSNVCYDFHQGFRGKLLIMATFPILFHNDIFAHGGAGGLCVYQRFHELL